MLKKYLSIVLILSIIVCLISILPANAVPTSNIPTDALNFNGHYYKVYSNVCNTWEEAKQYCENLGGHLATISSSSENNAIYSYIISCGYKNAYFGFSDSEMEGVWKWVNEEAILYTNWHSGEPNADTRLENYAMFYRYFTDGTWNDGAFGQENAPSDRAFICEWDGETSNSQSNELDFSKDVWNFENFSEERCWLYKNPYISKLSPSNRAKIEAELKDGAGGHCFGMSATVILQKLGLEDLTKYDGVDYLRRVHGIREAKSLICYYHAMQSLWDFKQEAQSFNNYTTVEQLNILSERADNVKNGGNPVLLCFGQSEWGAHAVVAYALEPGTFVSSTTGRQYNHRILLYDCNNVDWSADYCLLFNQGTGEWEIPHYAKKKITSFDGAYFICAAINTSTFDAIDDNRQSSNNSNPVVQVNSSERIKMKCKDTGEQWTIDARTGEIMGPSDLFGYSALCIKDSENDNISLNVVLPYSDKEYVFETESSDPADFDLSVLYTDNYLSVNCDSATGAELSSDGTVAVQGNTGEYEIVAANDLMQAEGKFDTFTFSGSNQGDTIISLAEDSISIEGDSIEEITVEASNENYIGKTTLEGTSSLELDNDMEGYETVQKTEPVYILGDADNDGKITILDATTIQRYLAEYKVPYPEITEVLGDVVGDGIDIIDATLIQRYLASFTVPYDIGEPI